MKKRKINLKRLSLQKKTIASVNANSIQGGTIGNTTFLATQLVIICTTTFNVPNTTTRLSNVETYCITCPGFGCPSEDGKTCPTDGPIIKTSFCD